MGWKKSQNLTTLKKQVKKIWTKIGQRKMHSNERLKEHKILKLEDDLKIAEIKLIWRWEKKKISLGLTNIIAERQIGTLRHRQFIRDRKWKLDSIASRLAIRASEEIEEITIARSKNGLFKKYRNKILLLDYNAQCRIRNCFICTAAP